MLLVKADYLITQNKERALIRNGGLVIEKDRIKAIGKSRDLEKQYSRRIKKIIDGRNKVVLPGLINTHTHLAMTLLRGYADDMTLEDWWFKYIYPAESQFTPEHIYWGSLLGALEMVKSGTTCCADFYYYQEKLAQVVTKIGLRAVLGHGVLGLPTFESKSPLESLITAENLIRKYQNDDLIKVSVCPHMLQTTPIEIYQKCKKLAKKYDLLLQTHAAETKQEVAACLKKYKKRPIEVLARAGILDKKTLLAHACWLTKKEIKILAQSKASVAHCPISNMKLGSGIMPLPEILKAGINVSLGTDGACSNNNLDLFEEMKMTALLHKINQMDPTIIRAQTVLDMATINGAKALGLGKEIGSLEPGKKADLIILDFEQPHLQPAHNIISHLVYAAKGSDVETVIIDGKIVMEGRKIKKNNQEKVLEKIKKIACFKKR